VLSRNARSDDSIETMRDGTAKEVVVHGKHAVVVKHDALGLDGFEVRACVPVTSTPPLLLWACGDGFVCVCDVCLCVYVFACFFCVCCAVVYHYGRCGCLQTTLWLWRMFWQPNARFVPNNTHDPTCTPTTLTDAWCTCTTCGMVWWCGGVVVWWCGGV